MTPQEINKRIAIACGWKKIDFEWKYHFPLWENDELGKRAYESDFNYHTNLNAMHEAEKTLQPKEREDFANELFEIVKLNAIYSFRGAVRGQFSHLHATAAQRAEAFLRTIGQWEDEK
jgi:hypothetical protein